MNPRRDWVIAITAAGFTITAILLLPLVTWLALLLGGHL